MQQGGNRSISRIRTFDGDAALVRETVSSATPKLDKKQDTAQDIADTLLKVSTPKAKDFLGDDIETKVSVSPTKKKKGAKPPVKKSPVLKKNSVDTKTPSKSKKKPTKDLQKELAPLHDKQTESAVAVKKAAYDTSNNDLDGGTIITNKRRKKHRLIPSMFTAIRSWFHSTKTELTTAKKPEHTVNKAESRIATITAAAKESKHAPQSDHGVVIKRLTKTKRKESTPEVLIKKKEEIAAPQWSSVADDLPTEPSVILDTSKHIEEKVPEVTPNHIHHELPQVSKPVVIAEAPSLPDKVVTPTKTDTKVPKAEKPKKSVPKKHKARKPKKESRRKKRKYKAAAEPTSGIPIYLYVVVILGASLLGIGSTLYWFGSATPVEVTSIVHIPSLFTSEVKTPVPLEGQTDLISTLADASFATRETMLVYPTILNSSGNATPADTQTIFAALNFHAPGSFTRSVTDINFGSYNGTDAFILMKVTNFDTAFGGLLSWEADMSADLSPLFGGVVTQSYDPYARTDTQLRSAFFRDTVISNKSVRVLVDEKDSEKIIYSFINPNLLLITTNTATFKEVLSLINQ